MYVIIGVIILCFVGLFILSHAVYGRSIMATVAELYLRASGTKKTLRKAEAAAAYARQFRLANDGALKIPAFVSKKYNVRVSEYHGTQVIELNGDKDSKYTVLYLHGGAYVSQMTMNGLTALGRISKMADIKIVAPLYALAPAHTYEETYEMLLGYYQDLRDSTAGQIIFLGDSAGGGLAIAFAEYLGQIGMEQPDKIITLSPWLDTTMRNPKIADYEAVDPMLSVRGLVAAGNAWAGDLDATDYRISPMFGDTACLDHIYFFVGTREMLYPDVTEFYEKLVGEGKTTGIYIGHGLNHVYPFYPIPEAHEAGMQIIDIILNR